MLFAQGLRELSVFLAEGFVLVADPLLVEQLAPELDEFCVLLGELFGEVGGVGGALGLLLEFPLEGVDLVLLDSQGVLVFVGDAFVLGELRL